MIHETPPYLANELVTRLPQKTDPDCIVDLGCGKGVLLQAALSRFPGTTAIGIDIQKRLVQQARKKLEGHASLFKGNATHYGFVNRALERVGVSRKDKILFVGNPPFGQNNRWRPTGKARELDAILSQLGTPVVRSSYPYQFLVTQLAFASNGGVISNIVPRSVLSADSWQRLRDYCLKQFDVLDSGQIGYHRFSGREVGVGILTLHAGGVKGRTQSVTSPPGNTLGAICSSIVRGAPVKRSKEAKRCILHSSAEGGVIVKPVRRQFQRTAFLPKGDIIAFLRVARAAGRVVYVRKGNRGTPFSDCIAMTMVPSGHAGPLSILYWSDQYRSERYMPVRGTGARYLTYEDIKGLPIPAQYSVWREELERAYARSVQSLDAGKPLEFFSKIQRELASRKVPLTFSIATTLAAKWQTSPA